MARDGIGGLKVHSPDGDNFAKDRYLASEPGRYQPPEHMLLPKRETKPRTDEVEAEPQDTTPETDIALDTAVKKDLKRRNIRTKKLND